MGNSYCKINKHYTQTIRENRDVNGKEESMVFCYGLCTGDKDWPEVLDACKQCKKWAYGKYIEEWLEGKV